MLGSAEMRCVCVCVCICVCVCMCVCIGFTKVLGGGLFWDQQRCAQGCLAHGIRHDNSRGILEGTRSGVP